MLERRLFMAEAIASGRSIRAAPAASEGKRNPRRPISNIPQLDFCVAHDHNQHHPEFQI